MERKRTMLLVASPANGRSTSQALGNCLAGRLQALGHAVESRLLYPAHEQPERFRELLAAAAAADLLLLAFPLYVDHLPAPLVRFLEQLHDLRRREGAAGRPGLAAIVNCGFPESTQCQPAADIVENFANRGGYRFLGCLMLGMGGFVSGRDLAVTGWMMRRQRRALRRAAEVLAAGDEIPAGLRAEFGRPLMPRWLYVSVANRGFRRAARRAGAHDRIHECPFADPT